MKNEFLANMSQEGLDLLLVEDNRRISRVARLRRERPPARSGCGMNDFVTEPVRIADWQAVLLHCGVVPEATGKGAAGQGIDPGEDSP